MSDGGGLFLWVTPSEGKLWQWKYRYACEEKLMSFGKYPDVSLAAAREGHGKGADYWRLEPIRWRCESWRGIKENVETEILLAGSLHCRWRIGKMGRVLAMTVAATNNTGTPLSYVMQSESELSTFTFTAVACANLPVGTPLRNAAITLPPATSCIFDVTFTPVSSGAVDGSFTISTASGPATFTLTGTGITQGAGFVFTPPFIKFQKAKVGARSSSMSVTASNYTGAPVKYVRSFGMNNFILQTGSCTAVFAGNALAAGSSCTFKVTSDPKGTGSSSGGLTFNTIAGPVSFTSNGSGSK